MTATRQSKRTQATGGQNAPSARDERHRKRVEGDAVSAPRKKAATEMTAVSDVPNGTADPDWGGSDCEEWHTNQDDSSVAGELGETTTLTFTDSASQEGGTLVSDLSDASKESLILEVERQRELMKEQELKLAKLGEYKEQIQKLEDEMSSGKSKRESIALRQLTPEQKLIENNVAAIVRTEIIPRWKFLKPNWEKWSTKQGTMTQIVISKLSENNWPVNVTEGYKKAMWEDVISKRLGRKMTVVRNKITQRMKDVYNCKL